MDELVYKNKNKQTMMIGVIKEIIRHGKIATDTKYLMLLDAINVNANSMCQIRFLVKTNTSYRHTGTRQIIRHRVTSTLRIPQIKQLPHMKGESIKPSGISLNFD